MAPQSQPKDPQRLGHAVSALFEQYGRRIQRFIRGRTRHVHNVDDLAQEVYLRLLRFAPDDVIRQPRAYLFRIASNVVHDFNLSVHQDRVTYDSDALNELADRAADIWDGDLADRLDSEQELHRILEQLPPLQQAVLVMIKRDGLSHQQVAKELRISPFTVRKYIGLAYAHFRAAEKSR